MIVNIIENTHIGFKGQLITKRVPIYYCDWCGKIFIKKVYRKINLFKDKHFCNQSCANKYRYKFDKNLRKNLDKSKNWWLGKKHSKETKKKISETHIELIKKGKIDHSKHKKRDRPKIKLYCTNCNKIFERDVSQYNFEIKNYNQENFFCTHKCCIIFQKNENHPRFGAKLSISHIEKLRLLNIGRKHTKKSKRLMSINTIKQIEKDGCNFIQKRKLYNPLTKQIEVFDSNIEISFLFKCMKYNIRSTRIHGIYIEYKIDENIRTYLPDFLLIDKNIIVEIKGDKCRTKDMVIQAKKQAAIEYCKQNNMSYIILKPKDYIEFFNYIV